MENKKSISIHPLYFDSHYCYNYDDFVNSISAIIDSSKQITEFEKQSKQEEKILYWLHPLIHDQILTTWLLEQSKEDAITLANILLEAVKEKKDSIKMVRHILLSLGFI